MQDASRDALRLPECSGLLLIQVLIASPSIPSHSVACSPHTIRRAAVPLAPAGGGIAAAAAAVQHSDAYPVPCVHRHPVVLT